MGDSHLSPWASVAVAEVLLVFFPLQQQGLLLQVYVNTLQATHTLLQDHHLGHKEHTLSLHMKNAFLLSDNIKDGKSGNVLKTKCVTSLFYSTNVQCIPQFNIIFLSKSRVVLW